MTIYRLHVADSSGESQGYSYRATKKQAIEEKRRLEDDSCLVSLNRISVTPTKAGIIIALNLFGSHPDNG